MLTAMGGRQSRQVNRGLDGLRCKFGFPNKHVQRIENSCLLHTIPKVSPWPKLSATAVSKSLFDKSLKQKSERLEFVAQLQQCSKDKDLKSGRALHAKVLKSQNASDVYVVSALISMYRKCGSMVDARGVFDSIQEPNVVHWNTLLSGYAENGEGRLTLALFARMKERGFTPDHITYLAALKACSSLSLVENGRADCLDQGRKIHLEISRNLTTSLQNTLVDMYSKCGSMSEARSVFDGIKEPDVVSWNALIMGYAANGDGHAALDLFTRMKERGFSPTSVTYVAALKACTCLAVDGCNVDLLQRGRQIHSEIGHHLNNFLESGLVDMYSKLGSMAEARSVFEKIKEPNVVHWNTLLMGYAANGEGYVALDMFSRMKERGCVPNSVTYVAAIKSCASLAANGDHNGKIECLIRGKEIHSKIDCRLHPCLQNTLLDMYSKCGSMVDARSVFEDIVEPNVVNWNTLLLGYAANGEGSRTLELFSRMKKRGCIPNSGTYTAVLKACTSLGLNVDGSINMGGLERGREVHAEIGCHLNPCLESTLIDMYSKCGSIDDARTVFDSIQTPDVVHWTSLIMGYADNGDGHSALDLFAKMKECGCPAHPVTYIAALKACALTGALARGRKFHGEITETTPRVVTCLVDFYAKCGSMLEAREVFDLHSRVRDISTWTALLSGYGRFGDHESMFTSFEAMQDEGLRPDSVTFACLLLCCNHAGLVEKATDCFDAIQDKYGLTPSIIHYNCMVDVLGRGNQLEKAIMMTQRMPCSPNVVTWATLLGACHKLKNVEIGREMFRALIDIDKKNAFPFVLMADIYGRRGMWAEQEKVLATSISLGAWKPPGQSNEFGKGTEIEVQTAESFARKHKG